MLLPFSSCARRGFAAALPLALAGAFCFRETRWRIGWEFLMTGLSFAAFYWSAVAILMLVMISVYNADRTYSTGVHTIAGLEAECRAPAGRRGSFKRPVS